jgi:hypothetical protein
MTLHVGLYSPPLEEGWLRHQIVRKAQTGWSEIFLTTPSAPN